MEKAISKFMSQTLVFAVLIAAPGIWAAAAYAQDAPASETTYDFEDDLVTGDLVRPDGEQLIVRRRGRRASLIQIRERFIHDIVKSVEDF